MAIIFFGDIVKFLSVKRFYLKKEDIMSDIIVGSIAPDFSLPATNGSVVQLHQYRGKKVIIFFYSKDNTPGCSNEVRQFGEVHNEIIASGAVLLGISRDSVQSHEKFSAKWELPYLLLSDADREVCESYQVLKEKNMYGKKVIGLERSTFIVDQDGIIIHALRKIKADGHAKDVLALLKS
jgi:peroxiredoxin Q/BCP